jgi:hypothetical protein
MAINADTSDPIDDSKGGVFSWGKFQQDKAKTVLVYVDVPEGTRGRQVQVTVLSRSLKVVALGKEVKSGALVRPVVVDESTWEMCDGKVLVTLEKQDEGWWDCVWEQDAPLDISRFDALKDMVSGMTEEQHGSMRSMVSRMFGDNDPTSGRAPTLDPYKD